MSDEALLQLAPIEFVGVNDEEEQKRIVDALMNVIDPEIGMDIVNLGLVYEVHVEAKKLTVIMTLTAIGCPLAGTIVNDVKQAIQVLGTYEDVDVEIVYSPPWDRDRLSRVAKMALGMY
ncbi:MAG: metal-sulfur cluster assembly factor [Candidatus Carbobacillus sp.]|nr:metal-sulfur cluster assembly factor [Candidatus Carbobacillus sp.]